MYIKRYAGLPGLYVPDEGEVVSAARSTTGPFARAVVVKVRRSGADMIRIDWVWLEDSHRDGPRKGFRAGEKGHAQLSVHGTNSGAVRRLPVTRTPSAPQGDGSGEGIRGGLGGDPGRVKSRTRHTERLPRETQADPA